MATEGQVNVNSDGNISAQTSLDFISTTSSPKEGEYIEIHDVGLNPLPSPVLSSAPAFVGEWGGGRISWMFDVDDVDVELENVSLLEELEIDVQDIIYKIRASLLPIGIDRKILLDSPDFWGPLVVVLSYGLILLWGQFSVLSWVFTLWLVGSILLFVLARVLGSDTTYAQTVGVIGYSLIPLVIVAFITMMGTILVSSVYLASARVLATMWCTVSAATLLGSDLLMGKRILLMYPMLLLYIYFLGLYSGI